MRKVAWSGALIVTAGMILSGAHALAARGGGPCQEDIQKFCKGVETGKVIACLQKHHDQLSESCRNHGKEMRGGAGEAPKSDRSPAGPPAHPKDTEPRGGAIQEPTGPGELGVPPDEVEGEESLGIANDT